MANLLALSPVLVLLLGALAVLGSLSLPRLPPLIPPVAALSSLLLLLVNSRQPDLAPNLFPAFASAPDLDLAFSFSPGGVFFASAALVGFLSLWIIDTSNDQPKHSVGRMATLSGTVAFFLAANWTTLAAAWLLSDLGLLVWSLSGQGASGSGGVAWRTLGLSQFGALVFLGAGVLVLNSGSSLRFESATLVGLPAGLVLMGAWIRSGLYPFQPPPSTEPQAPTSERLEQAALTFLLGSYLITRALIMTQGDFTYSSALYALALLGVGATALLALGETKPALNVAWTTCAVGAPVLLTPFVALVAARPSFSVWLGLGMFDLAVIGAGIKLLNANTRRRPLRRILWGAAILVAAGFPITPAFLGRIGLYASAIQAGAGVLVVALTAGTTLALIPLFRDMLDTPYDEEGKPNWLEYLGFAALLLPMIVEGLVPFVWVSFFGREVEDASTVAFNALYHAQNAWQPPLLFGALILPLPLAFFIARAGEATSARRGYVPRAITQLLDLSAVGRGVVTVLDFIGLTARQVSALVEQHPLGWILFAVLWVAVWLLNGLGGR